MPDTVAGAGRSLRFGSWKALTAYLETGCDWLAEPKLGYANGSRLVEPPREEECTFQSNFQGHQGPVTILSYSPHRLLHLGHEPFELHRVKTPLLATGGSDQLVKIWASVMRHGGHTYEACGTLSGVHSNSITTLEWWSDTDSASGESHLHLISGGADRRVVIWDLNKTSDTEPKVSLGRNKMEMIFSFGLAVTAIAMLPPAARHYCRRHKDHQLHIEPTRAMLVGTGNGRVICVDIDTGAHLFRSQNHAHAVIGLRLEEGRIPEHWARFHSQSHPNPNTKPNFLTPNRMAVVEPLNCLYQRPGMSLW